MKISNSKKELARIISENGGWREGAESAAQCKSDNAVSFYRDIPIRDVDCWCGECLDGCDIGQDRLIANWHNTILSRAEYFHLYPAPDADGWIEWKGGECPVDGDVYVKFWSGTIKENPISAHELYWEHDGDISDIIAYRLHKPERSDPEFCESVMRTIPEPEAKPTIEQLAADYRNAKDYAERKQKEADYAKADSDEKLRVLEIAGEALGLLVSPITTKQDPELAITDWRDLQVGDEVEYLDGVMKNKIGMVGAIDKLDHNSCTDRFFRIRDGYNFGWPTKWRFIRRP